MAATMKPLHDRPTWKSRDLYDGDYCVTISTNPDNARDYAVVGAYSRYDGSDGAFVECPLSRIPADVRGRLLALADHLDT
jgi:hypothetical protein